MNTVGIIPKCRLCGKTFTVFSVSVSHEGTHCNLYMECICVVCTKEKTVKWSFEQLSFYAMKLLDEKGEDTDIEGLDNCVKLPTSGEVN
jgi:hypothetical protein